MRPISVLLAIAAIAGSVDMLGAAPANARFVPARMQDGALLQVQENAPAPGEPRKPAGPLNTIAEVFAASLQPLGINFTLIPLDRAGAAQADRDENFEMYILGTSSRDTRADLYERFQRLLEEYNAAGFNVVQRFRTLRPGEMAEFYFYRKDKAVDWTAADLEKQFPPDAIFSLGKWIKGEGIVPKK